LECAIGCEENCGFILWIQQNATTADAIQFGILIAVNEEAIGIVSIL
jgi:hypothetical protein